MDRTDLLGKALGAIASATRCRATLRPRASCSATRSRTTRVTCRSRSIAGRVRLKGHGAARCCSPAIDLLERADDFPPDAPMLVITDG